MYLCFVFCFLFCLFPKTSSVFLFFCLSSSSLLLIFPGWLGRASPPVSWPLCPSGQPWRRPMGPLPCLTAACSSTNRPWPACSFSSRLLSYHQVWLRQRLARGCPDQSNPASCLAVVGQSARWQDRFGCFISFGVRLNFKQRVSEGQQWNRFHVKTHLKERTRIACTVL